MDKLHYHSRISYSSRKYQIGTVTQQLARQKCMIFLLPISITVNDETVLYAMMQHVPNGDSCLYVSCFSKIPLPRRPTSSRNLICNTPSLSECTGKLSSKEKKTVGGEIKFGLHFTEVSVLPFVYLYR